MSKHTPGPWKAYASESKRGGCWVIGMGKATLALLTGSTQSDGVKADAHLIAAAPDLLEGCRNLEWLVSELEMFKRRPEFTEALQQIAAAIAKAEGR
jgi:hypothetical protein